MNDLKTWLLKNYPDGKVDWFNEYNRLVNVVEQAVTSDSKAAKALLTEIALPTAKYLVNREENGRNHE